MNAIQTLQLTCWHCHGTNTAIHNSSCASWDSEVSIECILYNLNGIYCSTEEHLGEGLVKHQMVQCSQAASVFFF